MDAVLTLKKLYYRFDKYTQFTTKSTHSESASQAATETATETAMNGDMNMCSNQGRQTSQKSLF